MSSSNNGQSSIYSNIGSATINAVGACGAAGTVSSGYGYLPGSIQSKIAHSGYGSQTSYSITMVGAGGGGGSSSNSIMTVTAPSDYDQDVVIRRPDGNEIRVGATLEAMMIMLGVVLPDRKLMEINPVLKDAYDLYTAEFRKTLFDMNPNLKHAADSYTMLSALVKEDVGKDE